MPKAKHQDAMRRQWEILRMLPGKAPGISAADIIKELEIVSIVVNKRTIERDLVELSRNFGLVCNDLSKPYLWHWMLDAGIDLPALTLTDAFSLKIVESILKPLIPRAMHETLDYRFKEANEKLKAISKKSRHGSWADKVRNVTPTLSLLPPKINNGVLDTVQTALLKDKQVEVKYHSMDSDGAKVQILNPLAMVQRGPVTYLVATMIGYSDTRLYAVHRIKNANIGSDDTVIPKGFSIDEYIDKGALNFGSGKEIKLHACIDEWLYRVLEETPISCDQKLSHKDDESFLSATVQDTWQLMWWLMSQGNAIEVIRPIKLRNKIRSELEGALEQYNADS